VGDSLCNVAVDAMQTWVIARKNVSDRYAGLGKAIERTA